MILQVYVDEQTEALLRAYVYYFADGRTVEQLAEAAVAEAALVAVPPGVTVAQFLARHR